MEEIAGTAEEGAGIVGLPPSPNWFCSAAVSVQGRLVAYAAATKVVVLDGQRLVRTQLLPKRVMSVCWLQGRSRALAVGLDDGAVGTFDLSVPTAEAGQAFQKGHTHSASVVALACTTLDPRLDLERDRPPDAEQLVDAVVSVDKRGKLCRWVCRSGGKRSIQPAKEDALSVAAARTLAAIGYKSGAVVVVSFETATPSVRHWLRAHTLEVQCLSFVPEFEHIICSSARDKCLRLWDTASGTELATLSLPPPAKRGRGGGSRDGSREKIWLAHRFVPSAVAGPAPLVRLVSTTFHGDLLLWEIDSHTWKALAEPKPFASSGRPQAIFQICSSLTDRDRIVTISSDRQVVNWSVGELSMRSTLSTIGGHVYSVSTAGVDPDVVALGCGDNLIRVWNTEDASCRIVWKGIAARVTSVRWHATREGVLAYGLEDGTVGVCDVAKDKCTELASPTRHAVVSVRWGPVHPSGSDQLVSLATDGSVVHFTTIRGASGTHMLDALAATRPAEFIASKAVSLDWSTQEPHVLAIGLANGGVELVSRTFQHLAVVFCHNKGVTAMTWSPHTDHLVLATGSEDGSVCIHDAVRLLPAIALSQPHDDVDRTRRLVHRGHITDVAWSFHDPALLLSTSTDTTAQVWNVRTGEPLSNFRSHAGRVLCCAWSASNPSVAITGGTDHSARMWSWKDQPHTQPPTAATATKPANKKDKPATATTDETASPKAAKASGPKEEERPRPKRGKSVLPRSRVWKQQSLVVRQEACLQLAARQLGGGTDVRSSEVLPSDLGLFVGGAQAEQTIAKELEDHRLANRNASAATLDLWRGGLLQTLQQACEDRKLTEMLVAMSPHAGIDIWLQVVQRYAEQLEESGDPHGAATQFLLSGDANRAIRVYLEAHLYCEAVGLANLRAPSMTDGIYRAWALHSEAQNDLEQAAKCYITLNETGKAVRLLAQRGGKTALHAAMQLAKLANTPRSELIPKFVFECRREGDLDGAITATADEPEFILMRAALLHERALKTPTLAGGDKEWPGCFTDVATSTWRSNNVDVGQLAVFEPLPSQPCSMVYHGAVDRCIVLHAVGTVRLWSANAAAALELWCDALHVAFVNRLYSLVHFLTLVMFPPTSPARLTPAAKAWVALMPVYIAVVASDELPGEPCFVDDLAAYTRHRDNQSQSISVAEAVAQFEAAVHLPVAGGPPEDAVAILGAHSVETSSSAAVIDCDLH